MSVYDCRLLTRVQYGIKDEPPTASRMTSDQDSEGSGEDIIKTSVLEFMNAPTKPETYRRSITLVLRLIIAPQSCDSTCDVIFLSWSSIYCKH